MSHIAPAPRQVNYGRRIAIWLVVIAVSCGAILGLLRYLGPPASCVGCSVVTVPEDAASGGSGFGIPEPAEPVTFTLVAGGDYLMHGPVNADSLDNGRYNTSRLAEPVEPYIAGADLAICHMEVPLAAAGSPPSGYPIFAAPHELAEELVETGWDGCSTGSNHSVDQGYEGLARTLDAFDAAGLGHSGTARSDKESAQPQFYELEKDGATLTVAHIAYANNLNGLPFPDAQPWAINLNDTQRVLDQAAQARKDGADLVVVTYHCCMSEYTPTPDAEQVAAAEQIAASEQVDILISQHAHVPRPMTRLPGGPTGDGMWVVYGTGNFISNQDAFCCAAEAATGILAFFDVVKDPDGVVSVPEANWIAVHTERDHGHLVRAVTAEGSADSPEPLADLQRRHQLAVDVVGTDPAPERDGPPENPGTTRVVPRK